MQFCLSPKLVLFLLLLFFFLVHLKHVLEGKTSPDGVALISQMGRAWGGRDLVLGFANHLP